MKAKLFLTLLIGLISMAGFSQSLKSINCTPIGGYTIVKSTVTNYVVPISTPVQLSFCAWTKQAIDDTTTFVVNLSYDGTNYFPIYDTVFVPSDTAIIKNLIIMGGKRIKYTFTAGSNDSTGTFNLWHQPNTTPAVNFNFGYGLGITPTP